ncbi:MAG: hypothetical protein ACRESZ_05170, partial [Methylococcales bacterium]
VTTAVTGIGLNASLVRVSLSQNQRKWSISLPGALRQISCQRLRLRYPQHDHMTEIITYAIPSLFEELKVYELIEQHLFKNHP